MIERYIVLEGQNKGRIHDEAMAYDLATFEDDMRDETIGTDSLRPGKPEITIKDLVNDELKRLIGSKMLEELDSDLITLRPKQTQSERLESYDDIAYSGKHTRAGKPDEVPISW